MIGNYEGSPDAMLPGYAQYQQPMLSPVAMWDTGSHGSFGGTYCLKTATRAKQGSQNVSLKRVTFRHPGPIQLECYCCCKPEAAGVELSELDVRAVGVLLDLQDGESGDRRVMPHLRYLNALDGVPMLKWQYKQARAPFAKIGANGKTVSHYHLAAIFFVPALDARGALRAAKTRVQISPDGIHWVDEGTVFPLPARQSDLTFGRVRHFGGFLRLAARIPQRASVKVLVTLALKE